MAKQKINWTLRLDYENWANNGRHTPGSINSYCGYLLDAKNCIDLSNKLVVRGPGQVIGMTPASKPEDYLDLVGQFAQNGDKTYALTVLDTVLDMVLNSPKFGGSKRGKTISALKEYIEFIKQYTVQSQLSTVNIALTKVRNAFPKSMIHKIDGVESLAYLLGEQHFIKYAIENSYFFAPELVNERIAEIKTALANNDILPARKSKDNSVYQDSTANVLIYNDKNFQACVAIDSDGNRTVRSIITERTGYTVSAGRDSIFQSYKISHIWGKAFDPRYFTDLSNIVLVPAWANDLLDKQSDEGSLARNLLDTYKMVCEKLYGINAIKALDSSKTEVTKCPYWEYSVNVIEPLSQNEKVSQIVRMPI